MTDYADPCHYPHTPESDATITLDVRGHGRFTTALSVLDIQILVRGIDSLTALREECAEILTGDRTAGTHDDVVSRLELLVIIASCRPQPGDSVGAIMATTAKPALPAADVRILAIESDGRQTCHPKLLTLGAAQAELNVMRTVPSIVRIEIRQGSLTGPVVVGWTREQLSAEDNLTEARAAIALNAMGPGAAHELFPHLMGWSR